MEIENKVAKSGLIQLDLADFKPTIEIVEIDIAAQLWEGLILKEKDFRTWIGSNDWTMYDDKAVCVYCSVDAIIPTWAYMLVASKLIGKAHTIEIGNRIELEKTLIKNAIQSLDLNQFNEGKIIIKGCSDIASPSFAMVELMKLLQPIVKSIMYGEPCSTVPIYKRK
ncbi:MAG: hypothetical protein RIT10_76 [Bacteroidota bacterium]|jgi:hypothetical protein